MHDSFWTHATDVTEMNKIIRDQFIVLHENVDPDTKEPKCAPPFRPGVATQMSQPTASFWICFF